MATAIWFLIRRYINEPDATLPQGNDSTPGGHVLSGAKQQFRATTSDQKIPKAIPVEE